LGGDRYRGNATHQNRFGQSLGSDFKNCLGMIWSVVNVGAIQWSDQAGMLSKAFMVESSGLNQFRAHIDKAAGAAAAATSPG
jgi:hypothetical protein